MIIDILLYRHSMHRMAYLLWYLASWGSMVVAILLLDWLCGAASTFHYVLLLSWAYWLFALMGSRMRDIGWNRLWLLLMLIPLVNLGLVLNLFFRRGRTAQD